MAKMPSAPICWAWRASAKVSSTASALTWRGTGTRPATVLTAASANSLRSAIDRLSDSALWCGHEIAGAPLRTWKSSSRSKVGRSRLKSSLSGVTGLCITPRNLFCILRPVKRRGDNDHRGPAMTMPLAECLYRPSQTLTRYARPCAGHPRLKSRGKAKTWMAGTSPAMTMWMGRAQRRMASLGGDRRAERRLGCCSRWPRAGGAAEDAEFGAMRMVERHGARRLRERRPHFESRVVGNERAREHARPVAAAAPHHHAGTGAHDGVGRLAEDAPAGGRDFRHVGARIHLGKQHE